jgi:hypothetical protein
MKKALKKTEKKITSFTKSLTSIAFTNFSSNENTDKDLKEENSKDLPVADLFSYFTADIIKEEVIFTR